MVELRNVSRQNTCLGNSDRATRDSQIYVCVGKGCRECTVMEAAYRYIVNQNDDVLHVTAPASAV